MPLNVGATLGTVVGAELGTVGAVGTNELAADAKGAVVDVATGGVVGIVGAGTGAIVGIGAGVTAVASPNLMLLARCAFSCCCCLRAINRLLGIAPLQEEIMTTLSMGCVKG
jgi:poly-gamma-glutamate capsule biosynthesis protein CapA/YwtB (metallophosphatase superfamily)